MRFPCSSIVLLSSGAVAALAACGADPSRDVRERFAAFTTALRAGALDTVRHHVTWGSRAYVDQLGRGADGRGAVEVCAVEVKGSQAVVRVRETGGAEERSGAFVLAREDGEWRVDLIETAGRNSREIAKPGPPITWKFMPVPAVGERAR